MAAAISSASILAAAQVDDEPAYELSLHHTGLRSMLGLSRCVRLRVLDLSFNALRAIEGLDALGDLRELKVYATRSLTSPDSMPTSSCRRCCCTTTTSAELTATRAVVHFSTSHSSQR